MDDTAPRSMEGLRRGVPNSVYGVVVVSVGSNGAPDDGHGESNDAPDAGREESNDVPDAGHDESNDAPDAGHDEPPGRDEALGGGSVVGTARIVGDGGAVYYVCDMVVHPDHPRRGIGTWMMGALMDFVDETTLPEAYVNLIADVEGFYERWGFSKTAPVSRGTNLRVE